MGEQEALAVLAEIALKDRSTYPEDPWTWACENVQTVDEADQQIRPWPNFDYVQDLFELLNTTQLIAIPKSRRMFVSWALSVWCLHRARYHPNHAILWQSEVESKAAFVVDKRMAWVEEHLVRPALHRGFSKIKTSLGMVGKMTFENNSWVLAVAQGSNVFRAYTPSVLVIDECDFQPQANEALSAALPFAEKGAKLILCSTSNGPNKPLADICKGAGFTRF